MRKSYANRELCDAHLGGADPVILMVLYTAFIRSRMEYGELLFHKLKKKLLQKLEKVQYI
jgi:hypothetical protein